MSTTLYNVSNQKRGNEITWGTLTSAKLKSSTVPRRRILKPGFFSLVRYNRVPHVWQNQLVISFPDPMVADWLKVLRFSRPLRCLTCSSLTMMLDANIDAVILRQSEQLQTNTSTRPGPSVGYQGVSTMTVLIVPQSSEELKRVKCKHMVPTNTSCTVPQKHVAVASESVDQPSCRRLLEGMYGFVLSEVDAMLVELFAKQLV